MLKISQNNEWITRRARDFENNEWTTENSDAIIVMVRVMQNSKSSVAEMYALSLKIL